MRRTAILPLLLLPVLSGLVVSGCASGRSRSQGVPIERGVASWYGPGFHGRATASGQIYDMHALTAAHRTLPFGTVVEVRNLENGLVVRVTINDRGPFVGRRIIDLSRAAAEAIDMVGPGTARVELVAVGVEPLGGFVFAVQVGAFRELALAEELATRLSTDFPGVEIRRDEVWSRVQVGAFTTRDEARRLAARLQRLGYAAIVVPLASVEADQRPERQASGLTAVSGISPASAASSDSAVSRAIRT
jgi:rare lipoprotein A